MADTQSVLEQARETIEKQKAMLEQLTAPAWDIGTIVAVYKDSIVVASGSSHTELSRPQGTDAQLMGKSVRLSKMTGQLVDPSPHTQIGGRGVVTRVTDDLIEVEVDQGHQLISYSVVPVIVGDEVVMDPSGQVILRKLTRVSQYNLTSKVREIGWDDIGGLEAAKASLREAFELPYTHPEVYAAFKKQPPKGFLLHGSPGNGKTLLGRAVATAVKHLHKAASLGFIYIKGPEILSKWVGESEQRIREVFAQAREHKRQCGSPAVVFIDEADAILMARGSGSSAGMERTIVPQFLGEMDGLEDSCAIVLLATNRADQLDPAIIRAGRIDRKIKVAGPTRKGAKEITLIHMRGLPLADDPGKLADAAVDELFSPKLGLYTIDAGDRDIVFYLSDLLSGAMIAGVVEQATQVAISRNIGAKKVSGLCAADFTEAIARIMAEHKGMNHDDLVQEFVNDRGLEPISINPFVEGDGVVTKPKKGGYSYGYGGRGSKAATKGGWYGGE